jgi:hypothetical protein
MIGALLLAACNSATPAKSGQPGGTGGDDGTGGTGGTTGTQGMNAGGKGGGQSGSGGSGGQSGSGGSTGSGGAGGSGGQSGSGGAGGSSAPDAAAGAGGSVSVDAGPAPDLSGALDGGRLPAPPAMWMEHWFEHVQNLKLVNYNDDVAVYFDKDVTDGAWTFDFMTRVWRYAKATYNLGPEPQNRLFSVFHTGKYGGGHPSTYFDDDHDNRNVTDCGPGPWAAPTGYSIDEPTHESGHVVELANNGVHGSPAFALWEDSKWNEFYQYDLYVGLGLDSEAKRLFDMYTNNSDGFPRAGTHWFRDWFYPLWKDHGHAQVMVKFFKLLSMYFPKKGDSYSRDLNWGEYVHFTSGAAGTDLKAQATTAFGWPAAWDAQLAKAKTDFPMITY